MKRSGFLKRGKPMKRTAFRRKPQQSSRIELADGRLILRGRAWRDQKACVYIRDGGLCQMPVDFANPEGPKCLEPVPLDEALMNIDHIIRRAPFRDDSMTNLRTASAKCHFRRHEYDRKVKHVKHQ